MVRLAVLALSIALLAAFLVAPVSAADTNINDYYYTSIYWGSVFSASTQLEKFAYNESIYRTRDIGVAGIIPGPTVTIDRQTFDYTYAGFVADNSYGAGYVNLALPLALSNIPRKGSLTFFITCDPMYGQWFTNLESIIIALKYAFNGSSSATDYLGRDRFQLSNPVECYDQNGQRMLGFYFSIFYDYSNSVSTGDVREGFDIRSISLHFIRLNNLGSINVQTQPEYFIKWFNIGCLFDPNSIITDGDKGIIDGLGSLGDDITNLGDELSANIVDSNRELADKIDASLGDLQDSLTTPSDANKDAVADTQDKIEQAAGGLSDLGDKLNSVEKPPVTAIVPTPSAVLGDAEFFSPAVIDGLIKPVYNSKITLWLVSTVPIFALIGYVLFGKKS